MSAFALVDGVARVLVASLIRLARREHSPVDDAMRRAIPVTMQMQTPVHRYRRHAFSARV
jgi:hypothetical protein